MKGWSYKAGTTVPPDTKYVYPIINQNDFIDKDSIGVMNRMIQAKCALNIF